MFVDPDSSGLVHLWEGAGVVIPRRHFSQRPKAALVLLAAFVFISCSEKAEVDHSKASPADAAAPSRHPDDPESAETEGANELQPREDEIAEDCVAFLRATKVAAQANGDCVGCSAEGTEVLRFQQMQTNRISCSATACEVAVTIRASFNPGSGETLGGGLTAWIPAEQRSEYLRGHTPPGEQAYRVKIIYKRKGNAWRAIEFDKANPE